ncbi:MAG: CDP-diglyceride synthetase [Candidatus Saccharibacteria bacterium]|nr:CDP-diglyceride synthetase [Candidatus Saccharibacteria bacterium]
MVQDILFAIWFLFPAAISNAIPVFTAAIPFLKKFNAPIDAGKIWHGHRLLGPHKTWRGIISGIIVATLLLWVQQLLFDNFEWAHYAADGVNYTTLPTLILGPLFAIGALGGDAIESFFKRQKNIRSGKAWIPFDQLDYIIGSVIVTLFFVILSPLQYVWIFVVWFLGHLLASYIGYTLGLKEDPI